MSKSVINEGLEQNDLKRLVQPELHIDEYKSKMGQDEDIIVTSFKVSGREPAEDLVNFIEKGYDWVLDADISSGELVDGDFVVFVEADRNNKFPDQLMSMMQDIMNLTGQQLKEWHLRYRHSSQDHDLNAESIARLVPLSTEDYLRRYGTKALDEMRNAAGVKVSTQAPVNDYTQQLRSLAGII